MVAYRNIIKIENGCPLCNGELRGNDTYKYLCSRCFVKFDREHLKQGLFWNKSLDEKNLPKNKKWSNDVYRF